MSATELRITRVGERDEKGDWSYETKLDVCAKILKLGNLRLVSDVTKVPYHTILSWKKHPSWLRIVEEVKSANRQELNSKLSRIVNKSLEKVEDLIDNGDFVLNNKTGEVIRKPISLKDASKVASDLMTQQIKLEELDNRTFVDNVTIVDQLKMLANEFAKFNKRNNNNAQTIEYKEINDAVHDKRETGLQEGSSEVYEQAGSNSKTS